MSDVEHIEEWKGQDVVDPAGEKLGKLDEVYFRGESEEAVFAAVKSGLRRKTHLAPLAGASFSRSHVRLAVGGEALSDAPPAPDDGVIRSDAGRTLAGHYGLDPATLDGPFEGAQAREERLEKAAEARERSRELEESAAERRAEAAEARRTQEQAGTQAVDADAAAEQARRDAALAAREAEDVERPPGSAA
jgi:PRC-barrel domain